MKIYTVSTLSKRDFCFLTEEIKNGAFTSFDSALKRLKETVKKFKKDYKDEFKEYSKADYCKDEEDGALTIHEDYETGYWFCGFGFEDRHEEHQIYIDEWEVEE
jgi:hypothetical protein